MDLRIFKNTMMIINHKKTDYDSTSKLGGYAIAKLLHEVVIEGSEDWKVENLFVEIVINLPL